MSQFPNQYPPGYPQQAPQGYPQQAPQGYPQQAPQGYPQQAPQGYAPQQAPQGYAPQAPQGYAPPAQFGQPQGQPYGQGYPSNSDIYALIGGASVRGAQYPYLPAGNFVMEIVKFEKRPTRSKGDMIAVEWRALHSSTPEVQVNAMFGETFFICDGNQDSAVMAQGRLKALVCAIEGIDPQAPTFERYTAALRAASDPVAQALRGKVVAVYGTPATSKAGKAYVRTNYAAMQQTPGEVAARRAAQDANPLGASQAAPTAQHNPMQNLAPQLQAAAPQPAYVPQIPQGYAPPQGAPFVTPAQFQPQQAAPQYQPPQAPQYQPPQAPHQMVTPGGGQPTPGYAPGSLEAFQAQFGGRPPGQ